MSIIFYWNDIFINKLFKKIDINKIFLALSCEYKRIYIYNIIILYIKYVK